MFIKSAGRRIDPGPAFVRARPLRPHEGSTTMVWNVSRSMRLAALALCLSAELGCERPNEKDFAPTPGKTDGKPIDGEAQPRARKTRAGQPINE